MAAPTSLPFFAATAPGLEPFVAAELRALGAKTVEEDAGGVGFGGSHELLMKANLWLRTASRVLVRIAEFRAKAFYELERHAGKVAFEQYLRPGEPVAVNVTCRKSKLYHSAAVAERVLTAITARVGALGATRVKGADDEDETDEAPARVFVRFLHDECTLSVDSSGALLHRRGYRQAVTQAPLRETLAAAMLLASGWKGETALVDAMCGSGTLPIEAALLARRIAPGLHRSFAFERWRGFDPARLKALREQAAAQALPKCPAPILASDRNAGAIAAARSNAERAGVLADLQFEVKPMAKLAAPAPEGVLITNPPYGVRIGGRGEAERVYAELGAIVRERLPRWRVAVLSPRPELTRATGLALKEGFHTRNGGLAVSCMVSG